VGPARVDEAAALLTSLDPLVRKEARSKDQVWQLARLSSGLTLPTADDLQEMPGWSGFNAEARKDADVPEPHSIGYLPVIDASPTKLDVVYTLLMRSVETTEEIQKQGEKPPVIIVTDQAVYAKALEICSSSTDAALQRVVLRMGAFHIILNFLGVVGHRFASAGLRDILIEADVLASGSVDAVLQGRHYNRGLRVHKLVAEALERLKWEAFLDWNEKQANPVNLNELDSILEDLRTEVSATTLKAVLESEPFKVTVERYEQFCQFLGPNGQFWISYLHMVGLILQLVRSTREANWRLHMESLLELLPWFFAYDRTNYSRYLSVYLLDMLRLPATHPAAHEQLIAGDFAVQRSKGNKFGRIPQDQAIEVTINRDTKTRGGIIGMSLNPAAVFKWMILRADRAEYTRHCEELSGSTSTDELAYKDAGKKRVKDDEAAVQSITACIENWINPFQSDEQLCHLASGHVATEDVKRDLLDARQRGVGSLRTFAADRLGKDGTKDFYATLPQLQLKTFASMKKKRLGHDTSHASVLKSTRDMFGRLLVIGQSRELSMEKLLSYPLGPLPLSIATPDGSPVKTVKAKLLRALEDNVQPLTSIPRMLPGCLTQWPSSIQQKRHQT